MDPLSDIAKYPSGALRRAGASSGRAFAIAARDARRGRRGSICAEDRDSSLKSRALDGGRLSFEGFCDLQIVLSAFSIFQPELARPRAYDRERSTSSSRVKPFHSRVQKSASNREPCEKSNMAAINTMPLDEQARGRAHFHQYRAPEDGCLRRRRP